MVRKSPRSTKISSVRYIVHSNERFLTFFHKVLVRPRLQPRRRSQKKPEREISLIPKLSSLAKVNSKEWKYVYILLYFEAISFWNAENLILTLGLSQRFFGFALFSFQTLKKRKKGCLFLTIFLLYICWCLIILTENNILTKSHKTNLPDRVYSPQFFIFSLLKKNNAIITTKEE